MTSAGVMHCIVMHVPAHRGGLAPTAYLKTPNGGQALTPGAQVAVEWLADDDEGVTAVDLQLSANDGQSYPYTLATNLPHTGSWTWTVPNLQVAQARLRVVARDAQGRAGQDASDAPFGILGTQGQATAIPYGAGKPGQNGVPALAATPPVLGAGFTLSVANALPLASGVLLVGSQPAATPFDGGTIHVLPFDGLALPIDAAGGFAAPVPLPDEPLLVGFAFYVQAWFPNDPGASGAGWSATSGLQLRFGH